MREQAATGGARRGAWDATIRWAGGLTCVAGIAAWAVWFGWRATASSLSAASLVSGVLEVAALAVSIVIGLSLWSRPATTGPRTRSSMLPETMADVLGLDDLQGLPAHGVDDSGEFAQARRAIGLLNVRQHGQRPERSLASTAWAFVAVEGIRRMAFVVVLVAVLLTGRAPFEVPPVTTLLVLVAAQLLFAVGHWLLSGGVLRPGARLRWSVASIGAGLGDGTSRSGLPIRWTATLGTMIVLNLAVALRGVSDRWTHGLGPMPHDERVVAMLLAWWLVIVGFAALRILTQPSLGFYGATHRLEENSTRRLALGTTMAVSMVGFVAGVLPGGLPA